MAEVSKSNMIGSLSLGSIQGSSREALRRSLIGIMGPEGETRQTAEEKIKALEVTEQYGTHLLEFVLDPNYELGVRELASTKLNHYIINHWDSSNKNSQLPKPTLESKKKIRESLLPALKDPNGKIRGTIADSISTIAGWDWPKDWTEFLDTLVICLNEDNEFSLHGAMRVLTGLTEDDLSLAQVECGSSVILREMYRIFEHKDQYSLHTRNQAVDVFTKIVSSVTLYDKSDSIQRYLKPEIPKFCEKFIESLGEENDFENQWGLKMEIVKAIEKLITKVPKFISTALPQMIPMIWEILMDIGKVYQDSTVNGGDDIIARIDNDVDCFILVLQMTKNFYNLAVSISEFFANLMTMPTGYDLRIPDYNLSDYHWFYLLDNYIPPEALYCLINLMQITKKQIEVWKGNVNVFIRDEELKSDMINIDNVRRGTEDLLIAIIDHPERAAANSLIVVILKQLEAENTIRANGNPREDENWWKSHEAFLVAFCHAKEIIINKQKAETLHFDIVAFLENVVLADLNDPDSHPLLIGRCLYVAGIYADQIPPKLASRFLKATVEVLQTDGLSLSQLCAVAASTYWCIHDHSVKGNSEKEKILKSHLRGLFKGLYNLGSQLLSWEITTLILRALVELISVDKSFTPSIESKICALAIAAFSEYPHQCWIHRPIGEVFEKLTLNPDCIRPLQRRLLPTLIRFMNDADLTDKHKAASLDALQILVDNSPQPLSHLLIEEAFPACCTCILNLELTWPTSYSETNVIHSYLKVAAQQVISYRDKAGKTGTEYILELVARRFNSKDIDCTFCKDYEIIILLIKSTAGNMLGGNIDELLKALLCKMQRTKIKSFERRSILIVFAHLLNTQFDTVFKFLTTAPGCGFRSALALVMSDGFCKEHEFFKSGEDLKTVTLALSKVLEHGVINQNSPLHKITFQDGPITSSKILHGRVIQMLSAKGLTPLLVKISKLITNYLSNCEEVETK